MDESKGHVNPNPTLTANVFSRLFFCWVNPLFSKGYKGSLEESDLYNVCPSDESGKLGDKLQREWDKELKRREKGERPSLLKALFNVFGLQYILVGIVVLFEEATKVVQPILLGGLIRYFTPGSQVSKMEAYLYAFGVSFCAIMLAVAHHPYFFTVQRIGMRMRVACCSLMYKKCMKLSNKAMGETTTGQIVNLMSNDVNRFDQSVIFLHFLWVGPLQAIAVLAILWHELGPSVLSGFLVLLLLIPVQGFMGKLFSKLRHKTAVHTDERVKVMNEIITGMRVIKMYCWEKPFGQLVEKIRSEEMDTVRTYMYLLAKRFVLMGMGEKLLAISVLTPYLTAGHPARAKVVFAIVMYMNALHRVWIVFMMLASECMATTDVVLHRITVSQQSSELKFARRRLRLAAITASVWVLVHRFLYYVFALTVTLIGSSHILRPARLYTGTPLFFLLAYNLVGCVFEGVRRSSEGFTAKTRIQKFLLLEEIKPSGENSDDDRPETKDAYVELNKVTAKWEGTTEQNTLQDISLRVNAGELIAVIGPVGSGKSSLLMNILGELPSLKGKLAVSGKVAYVSQQPWIFSGSIRQNIVFGGVYDKAKYDRIVKVSALKRDFEIMPQGDATLIGDRGVSLSGGQRARVSLARALYLDADIYLLDDPLSAVDAAVGRHIFEKCIVSYLKKKPRILVTHQVQFLPVADNIIILKEGAIESQGSFDELSRSGVDFAELLKQPDEEEPTSPSSNPDVPSFAPLPEAQEFGSQMSLHSMIEDYEPEAVQLPEVEERASGTVGFRVYVEYFKAGAGLLKFILLVLVNLAAQVFYVGSDWWLSKWSNEEEDRFAAKEAFGRFVLENNITDPSNSSLTSNITIPYVDSYYNIGVFSGIIALVFLFGLIRALLFFKIAVDASQTLHNRMFERILRTQVSFFDTNPVGRILNRFSKDIGHMDDLLPVTFFDFIQCALLILGIVLVAGAVNPWAFIPTVPLAITFVYVRKYYLQTSRSIKRLEGTSRSPVFSHLSASLQGIHTIRSMKMEGKFVEEFDTFQDRHSEAWFLFLATSRWLAVRLDWLCALFVTAVTFCAVLAADSMSPGLVGLSITYTMTLMGMFQWGVRQSAEVENQMISVERVLEYTRLPQEAALESDKGKKPPPGWPHEGTITGKNVCLRYSPASQLVLKDLNFEIKGKEKIGIVGRTGAGKSSLITTLFRMVEPSGSIIIDGIDIQAIGLHDLRNTIAIIPQDPVLFTGSLRKNLDPFNQHQDEQLWKALEEVKLKDAIKDIPEGLLAEVSEGGVNFSVGQRQLICLARAVLRHNKILLIDEATANVDPITDELIQETIRTKFKECTVLTIAHRLHTIMDSDRVLMLDNGRIVEFEVPYILLKQGHGFFYEMVQQTGKAEFDHLVEIAKEAALKNKTIGALSFVLRNGTSVDGRKSTDDTLPSDSTMKDVPSVLNSNTENEGEGTYDISDIEDSLRAVASEDNEDSALLRDHTGNREGDTEDSSADKLSNGDQVALLPLSEEKSDSSSSRQEEGGVAGGLQRKGVDDEEDDADENRDDEDDPSQVLLKPGQNGKDDNVSI